MTVAIVGVIPGGNAEMDQQMLQQIGVSPDSRPAGALARFAGPTEGGYRIVSLWESEEAWNTFQAERLDPYFEKAGRPMPPVEVWQVDTLMA